MQTTFVLQTESLKHYAIILATLLLSACQSNEIYLDEKTQMICSESNKGIRYLNIESLNGEDYYHLEWDREDNPPKKLSISPITKGYKIEKCWYRQPIKQGELKLLNDSTYIIQRYGGDATDHEIEVIVTDDDNHLKFVREHKQ